MSSKWSWRNWGRNAVLMVWRGNCHTANGESGAGRSGESMRQEFALHPSGLTLLNASGPSKDRARSRCVRTAGAAYTRASSKRTATRRTRPDVGSMLRRQSRPKTASQRPFSQKQSDSQPLRACHHECQPRLSNRRPRYRQTHGHRKQRTSPHPRWLLCRALVRDVAWSRLSHELHRKPLTRL